MICSFLIHRKRKNKKKKKKQDLVMISWILVTLIAYTKDTEAIEEGHTLKTWDYHWMRLHIWQTNLHIGYLPYKYVGRKYVNHEEITNVFHESLMMYSNVKTKFIGNFYYQGQNFLLNFLMLKTNKLLFMVSILMINWCFLECQGLN